MVLATARSLSSDTSSEGRPPLRKRYSQFEVSDDSDTSSEAESEFTSDSESCSASEDEEQTQSDSFACRRPFGPKATLVKRLSARFQDSESSIIQGDKGSMRAECSQSDFASSIPSLKPPLRILRRCEKPPELSAHWPHTWQSGSQAEQRSTEQSGDERGDGNDEELPSPPPPPPNGFAGIHQGCSNRFKKSNDIAVLHLGYVSFLKPLPCNMIGEVGGDHDESINTTRLKTETQEWLDRPKSPSEGTHEDCAKLPYRSKLWSSRATTRQTTTACATNTWAMTALETCSTTKSNPLPCRLVAAKTGAENCDPAFRWAKAAKQVAAVRVETKQAASCWAEAAKQVASSQDRNSSVDCTSDLPLALNGIADESDAKNVSYVPGQRVYGYFYGDWFPATVTQVEFVEKGYVGGFVKVVWDSEHSSSVLAKDDVAPMYLSEEPQHEPPSAEIHNSNGSSIEGQWE